MNRSNLSLLLAAAALVAGGALWSLRRARSPSSAGAPPAGGPAPAVVDKPAGVEAVSGGDRSATASAPAPVADGRQPTQDTQRRVTDQEREAVYQLIKMHSSAGQNDPNELGADPLGPSPWPTDDDSLFLKHGGLDKAALIEEAASIQAILKWQSEGPFEDKRSQLMPDVMLRAFERELEWLQQRIQEV